MNRALQVLNLLGVLALVALCSAQWRSNRRLNLEVNDLERIRLDQVSKLAERDTTIKGYVADLDDFRTRLTLAESQLKELDENLSAITRERNQMATEIETLAAQRDQLKASIAKWQAAVAERDAALKQSGEQIQNLMADRNDAVAKFNELAAKYNTIVKDFDTLRAKQQ